MELNTKLSRVYSNLSPSPELSYVVGVMFGDGYVCKKNPKIQLLCKDQDFADVFAKTLKNIVGFKPTVRRTRRGYYTTGVYRKDVWFYFKERNISRFKDLIINYPADFVRGFYDSEGCVVLGKSIRNCSIQASNTDFNLLNFLSHLLERRFKIKSFISVNRKGNYKPCFRLTIKRQVDILRFGRYIGFTIKRKMERLKILMSRIESLMLVREQRERLRKKAISLRQNGLSLRKIEKIIGVPSRTILNWQLNPKGNLLVRGYMVS